MQLLRDSLDRIGRMMMAVQIALGLLAGLASSHFVAVTDQQWANITLLALMGAALGFLVDLFSVTPFRGWDHARKDVKKLRKELSREQKDHARDVARLHDLERQPFPFSINGSGKATVMYVGRHQFTDRFREGARPPLAPGPTDELVEEWFVAVQGVD